MAKINFGGVIEEVVTREGISTGKSTRSAQERNKLQS
jgi:uncharacterized protein YheU (UPF0270 family)